ncbi:RNA polymerase subunit sigma [Hanstruepera neustonica]|uniref:RNA polymerase subunit sigma n=1 Tax=Hanstruepera neustonica TaxID=1445657 RepID=A0A2K1DWE8_9FLAO|nr:RNA polymerase sigma factor [Hanstruepera neustonica]PNQ72319.1 RNA polymerase subunit sigma [Hanstruepera neustonica]
MTLTTKNIEELVELCKTGNQFAQLEIYNRYYKAMYNVAFRIVKDSFEAEDIMQDSFLSAFTKLDSINDTVTFGSWLKRIVINNSIYHFNKNNKYQNVPFDNVMYKIEDVNHGIDSDFSNSNDKAKLILKTLDTLKDNYRVALTLHLIEGYDYEEIGGIMGMSYANCRTTISRAKESLRQKLQPLVNH